MFRKRIIIFITLMTMFASLNFSSIAKIQDYNTLVNTPVTLIVFSIRTLNDDIVENVDGGFFVKMFFNDSVFESPVWNNSRFLYNLNWSVTQNIPKDQLLVPIKIQLWFKDYSNVICDISPDIGTSIDSSDVEIVYDMNSGHWVGDDTLGAVDTSGYGRLNGYDDGSYDQHELDCELWFDITQMNTAGDSIPVWMKENVYHLDSTVNYTGYDPNNDGIPITWDWKYGYNPFANDNHSALDADNDGLDNYEEYRTSQWGSDPFRKDLFLELDQMVEGPRGEGSLIKNEVKELITSVYHKHNIVFHLDTGTMGGGEILPFKKISWIFDDRTIYNNYFLHNGTANWRSGIFRYGIIVYQHKPINGLEFSGEATIFDFYTSGINSFIISSKALEKASVRAGKSIDFIFAGAIVHELGHSMGLYMAHPPGCDNQLSKYPWQPGWWRFINYKSSMNYHYTYSILDYSDGSHGRNDFDDWSNLDLTFFQLS